MHLKSSTLRLYSIRTARTHSSLINIDRSQNNASYIIVIESTWHVICIIMRDYYTQLLFTTVVYNFPRNVDNVSDFLFSAQLKIYLYIRPIYAMCFPMHAH